MAFIIAITLSILALSFVLYPLFRRETETTKPANDPLLESIEDGQIEITELAEREQTARSAIQEVELDYQLGNIAEPDYRTLRERYMRRALVALKSRYEREQEIDEEIEAQLRKLKESYEQADH